jgi:DNA-binding XRE family transcriptional regulator
MHQSQVAKYAGINRTTYIAYENGGVEYYPLDILSKIAILFEIDIKILLDDYHRYLYNGQGKQVKALRKRLRLTQEGFADVMNVCDATVRRWEKEYIRVMPDVWEQLCKMGG